MSVSAGINDGVVLAVDSAGTRPGGAIGIAAITGHAGCRQAPGKHCRQPDA